MTTGSSSSPDKPVPVAPDSVRVWTGFRLPSLPQDSFFEKLGSIFIPGTVQIQSPVKLTAYLPSVLPREKQAGTPDEIALVFYEYQDAYHEAKDTVGGRAYSDMHALVFDLSRSLSGFPRIDSGSLEPDGRYHLFDGHIDWQSGVVSTYVGACSGASSRALEETAAWLSSVQESENAPDGAVAAAAADYVVYWEHWPDEASAASSRISELRDIVEPAYQHSIDPYPLPERLWAPYVGVEVNGGESFNFQFARIRNEG
jgi:hypothetical protein